MEYSIGDNVIFIYSDNKTAKGKIIGIANKSDPVQYCVLASEVLDPSLGYFIEESDKNNFNIVSDLFNANIGKKGFWKNKSSILRKINIVGRCVRCKEFNNYAESESYTCWSCTNYPYR